MSKIKLLAGSLIIASFFLLFISRVWAVGMEVSCGTGGCTLSTTDPLFLESNLYPGWSTTKTVKAKNNYAQDRDFAVEVAGGTFSDSAPSLAEILTITITEQESSAVVYGPKTIKEWKDEGFVVLSTIPAGGERNYELEVAMGDVGNEYQGKALGFDLSLGFESVPPGEEGEVLGAATVLAATGLSSLNLLLALFALGLGILLRRYAQTIRG